MSCCGQPPCLDDLDGVSALLARRLTAFIRTLRDNGFAVGLREGQDAAILLARGYGERAGLLRSALKHLFCTRKADWDRFGEIFDVFWLRKNVRSRLISAGTPGAAQSPSVRSTANAPGERSVGRSQSGYRRGAQTRRSPAWGDSSPSGASPGVTGSSGSCAIGLGR